MRIFKSVEELFEFSDWKKRQIGLEGVLKAGDNRDTVLFSPVGCNSWVPLTKSSISEIEYLSEKRCTEGEQSHSYPYVRISVHLDDGSSEGAFLKAIAQLLQEVRLRRVGRSKLLNTYLNVGIYNIDTSLNTDTYIIQDVVGKTRTVTPPVQGGDTYYFSCVVGDDGYGELYITNTDSGVPNHFPFVRDNDVYSL
jgi:hypothetical protein